MGAPALLLAASVCWASAGSAGVYASDSDGGAGKTVAGKMLGAERAVGGTVRATQIKEEIAMRRAVYETKNLRRDENRCLSDAVNPVRFIQYNGTEQEVSIAYANWASAR